jgi:UDP-3-O-[3-hydroxymyristoyl] glucosamine N-acyltransferase
LPFTLGAIAAQLGCTVSGDSNVIITGVAGLDAAKPGELTFLANKKYTAQVGTTQASAIVAARPASSLPTLISINPYLDFARALELFYSPPRPATGVHPTAFVDATASIGPGASIGAFCAIGARVTVGRNAVLHPHVVIYEGARIGDDLLAHSHVAIREFCRIGNRVTLQNSVVIGGDGFGFARRADGTHAKIVQSGVTVIEDDVEIQSLTSIDRATVGETRVKRGAKIDSLVQVGHACVVGEDNIICAQTGLAGSSILERDVLLAGQVGISGHLTIHQGAIIYAQSGIGGDVPAGAKMSGSPAFGAGEWLRAITAFPRIPELMKALRDLTKRVAGLESK